MNMVRSMQLRLSCILYALLFLIFVYSSRLAATPIGICYGRVANNLPSPQTTANLLKSNGITTVRIFDKDPTTLTSFSGTGTTLMVGVPNENLPSLASGATNTSLEWLELNIFTHIPPTQVKYIAVGNEIFSKDTYYTPFVVPAMNNLYQALKVLNLESSIKLSSPQAASVLATSYPPSRSTFDQRLVSVLVPLFQFLRDTNSPFMVNLYPYISYISNAKYIPLDYALFTSGGYVVKDGELVYDNLFDASIDAFYYAVEKLGFGDVKVVLTETGWPTAGGEAASVANALEYNGNVARRVAGGVGTPKRPGEGLEVYLFGVFDENGKVGEEYEKHFGIFGIDGTKVYGLDFN